MATNATGRTPVTIFFSLFFREIVIVFLFLRSSNTVNRTPNHYLFIFPANIQIKSGFHYARRRQKNQSPRKRASVRLAGE
jgi:hypothetical protein